MLHNTAFFDHCTLAKGPRATDPDSTWVRPEHGKRCLEGLPLVDKLNRVLRGVGQLLQRRLHQQGVSRARQLCGCAVASVVALQAQGQATQARELSTLAPLRDLRAHASDPAWTRRAVDEGVEVLSESAVREIRPLRSMRNRRVSSTALDPSQRLKPTLMSHSWPRRRTVGSAGSGHSDMPIESLI